MSVFTVALLAIVLIVVKPPRVPAWVWPAGAAAAIVAVGAEPTNAAVAAVAQQWNVLLFIFGLMGLSVAAENSGAFAWITQLLLARARGSRRRLFVLLFAAGALTTIVLSNDATAIVLTPIVYRAVVARGGDPMPYLFTCTFVADTASFGLPFSNPANVLILPHPQLLDYALHLGPPQIAAIAINLAVFLALFSRQLRGSYAFEPAPPPQPGTVRVLCALAAVVPAYVVALALNWPIGPVAAAGGIVALAVARVEPVKAFRTFGWGTFALLAGLFVLLDAVARGGLIAWASGEIAAAMEHGSLATLSAAAGGAALLSNLLNNLPVAVASSFVVLHDRVHHLAYALIAGVDLGPNLTPAGSLATLLWLAVLRDRGVRVNPLEYLRLGIAVVPAMLAATVSWLAFVR